jgi:hypothetical protein
MELDGLEIDDTRLVQFDKPIGAPGAFTPLTETLTLVHLVFRATEQLVQTEAVFQRLPSTLYS